MYVQVCLSCKLYLIIYFPCVANLNYFIFNHYISYMLTCYGNTSIILSPFYFFNPIIGELKVLYFQDYVLFILCIVLSYSLAYITPQTTQMEVGGHSLVQSTGTFVLTAMNSSHRKGVNTCYSFQHNTLIYLFLPVLVKSVLMQPVEYLTKCLLWDVSIIRHIGNDVTFIGPI